MTARPKLLDLFCGAGGAAAGYDRAGFRVTGVDHKPQKHYPFEFHQADALEFCREHGHEYDAIHASPPCQAYSTVTKCRNPHLISAYPDLLAPTRRVLAPFRLWVIENVVGSPVQNAFFLCGLMFGLHVLRHRVFESSTLIWRPEHPKHPKGNLTGMHQPFHTRKNKAFVSVTGHDFHVNKARDAMGIDWMTRDELAQAIPPAYTEYIGEQLIERLAARATA